MKLEKMKDTNQLNSGLIRYLWEVFGTNQRYFDKLSQALIRKIASAINLPCLNPNQFLGIFDLFLICCFNILHRISSVTQKFDAQYGRLYIALLFVYKRTQYPFSKLRAFLLVKSHRTMQTNGCILSHQNHTFCCYAVVVCGA